MRRTYSLVISLALLSACGGTSDGGTSRSSDAEAISTRSTEDPTPEPTAETAVTASDQSTASESLPPVAADTSGGDCSVSLSGAVTAVYSGSGGFNAVNSAHWFTAEELQTALDDFGFETPALVLNCDSGDGTLVTLSKSSADSFPFSVGTITFEVEEISVTTNFGNGDYLKPDVPATVEISAFDATRLAGSASFTAKPVFGGDDLTTVELTFDFTNPNP
jgi:hypothetical protein